MRRILFAMMGIGLSLTMKAQTVVSALQETANLTVFSRLVEAVGLTDTLSKVRDEEYEILYLTGDPRVADLPRHPTEGVGSLPEHRYYGYTLFVENDDFWRQTLGKEPADISPADIQAWVVSQGFYPDAKDNTDYEDEDNALNQFLTYHILPMRITPDKLVIHYNECGYNYKSSTQFTIPTYELYTTMGKRRLIKLYQCGPSYSLNGDDKIYLNRFPELDDGRTGTYKEVSVTPETEGIVVNTDNSINLRNGYIYTIDKPLVCDENTRTNFQKQRLRFDFAGLFPEFMNNNIRANRTRELQVGIPIDKNYKYLDDVDIEEGTNFYYFSGLGRGWYNWQGDEFNIVGNFDFTVKLPPVPNDGIYELRIGTQSGSTMRSIVQFYIGQDKENLVPTGWALDMREGGTRNVSTGAFTFGWEQDSGDEIYDRSVDLRLYEMGVMKAPANYAFRPGGTDYARNSDYTLRRIVYRGYLQAGQTYYLRVRNLMDDPNRQCYLDYLELCPKSVYASPEKAEDIW